MTQTGVPTRWQGEITACQSQNSEQEQEAEHEAKSSRARGRLDAWLLVLSGLVARETAHYLKHDPKLTASAEEIDAFMVGHERHDTEPDPAARKA